MGLVEGIVCLLKGDDYAIRVLRIVVAAQRWADFWGTSVGDESERHSMGWAKIQ
jgi:hypothetical protein